MQELTNLQQSGLFWLPSALGADFLFYLAAPGIVHITGVNKDNDVCAGTGIIFHPNFILTCAHVINDMSVNKEQLFQGKPCSIVNQHAHDKADVAVVQVDKPLAPVPGLAFLNPTITQPVFTLGYPKIPFAREAALTIQCGEVTNEKITTLDNKIAFLYSAIARPGNSGGPIISNDGHVVGISMQDHYQESNDNPFSPHYAGVPTDEIARCLDDFNIGVQIPIEDFK